MFWWCMLGRKGYMKHCGVLFSHNMDSVDLARWVALASEITHRMS